MINILDYKEGMQIPSSKCKIRFTCINCGSEYIIWNFNFTKPMCPGCKRKATSKTIDWSARNKKSEQTKLQRYGDPHYVNPTKGAKTKEERYGDSKYNNKEKNKQTCKDRYGVEYVFQNKDTKDKIKKICTEKYGGMGASSEIIQQKIKNTNKGKYGCEYGVQSEIVKDKIKQTCLDRYGVSNGGASYLAKQKMHRKYLYDDINFDSSWEIALYIYLKDNNIPFEYQPNIRFEYYYDDIKHFYYPDFKINGEYIEIKGDQFFENNSMINPFDRSTDALYNEKYKCMLSNNIKILTSKDMFLYIEYINETYGDRYIDGFRRTK